jgi:hypothetical protein
MVFIFAGFSSIAIVAHVLPPPSLPAKRLFFLMMSKASALASLSHARLPEAMGNARGSVP